MSENMLRLILIANGMTPPRGDMTLFLWAYLLLIEILGTGVGTVVLMRYFKRQDIRVPVEVVAFAMALAMATSWILGMMAWGWAI